MGRSHLALDLARLPQLPLQPSPRHRPIPLHRLLRDPQHPRALLHTQPRKEPQLHDLPLTRIPRTEPLQRLVQRHHIHLAIRGGPLRHTVQGAQRHVRRITATLVSGARPRMIDQHVPHHRRRRPHEMIVIGEPLGRGREAQIHLMHQRRRRQAVARPRSAQIRARERAELGVRLLESLR